MSESDVVVFVTVTGIILFAVIMALDWVWMRIGDAAAHRRRRLKSRELKHVLG